MVRYNLDIFSNKSFCHCVGHARKLQMITEYFQLAKAKKRRASAPADLPDQPPDSNSPTEVINGVTVTEEVLKKIGRNVLKAFGIGLEDRRQKVQLLPDRKKRALKACQVRYFLFKVCLL